MNEPYTVLIADDDISVRQALQEQFLDYGFLVFGVDTIDKALDVIARERIDGMVLDMRMPDELDGLRLLRATFHFGLAKPALPIIVFTAYPTFDNCVASIKAGASDYVPKSIPNTSTFREVVRRCEALIENPPGRPALPDNGWFQQSYRALLEHFGGKTIAVLDPKLAETKPLPGAVTINGMMILGAGSLEELRHRLLQRADIRDSLPFIARLPNAKD